MTYNTEIFSDNLTDFRDITYSFFLPYGSTPKSKTALASIQNASIDFCCHLGLTLFGTMVFGGCVAVALCAEVLKKTSLIGLPIIAVCIAIGAIAYALAVTACAIAIVTRALGTVYSSINDQIDKFSSKSETSMQMI